MAKIRIVRDGIYRNIDEFRWHEFKSKGYSKVVEPVPADDGKTDTGIKKMTVEQLKKYADDNSINLGEATKKADIIEAIETALAAEDETATKDEAMEDETVDSAEE